MKPRRGIGLVQGAVVLLCATAFASSTSAQTLIRLSRQTEWVIAGPHLAILEDRSRALTINDVTTAHVQQQFELVERPVPIYGYTPSAYWLRLSLTRTSDAEEEWFLSIGNKSIDLIDFFAPDDQGGWLRVQTGDAHPFETRPIPERHFVFPLTVADTVMTFYLRVASSGPVYLPVRILSRDGFIAHTRRSNFLLGGLFGILLVFALFHLAFYVAARDDSYLYYVGFLAALLLYNLAVERIAFQFIWPDNLWLADRANSILGLLAFILAIQFTRSFLNTRLIEPRWDRALAAGTVVAAILMVFYLGGLNRPLAMATVVYFVVLSVMILVCGIIAAHRRQPAARHYLVAWSFLIAGTVATMLGYLSVLPPHYFAGARGVQVGSALTITLFAVALGHRLRLMQRARRDLRIKIASDLHDDIGAGLTEIALTSYLIRSHPDTGDVDKMAYDIESRARALTDTMRDIVWAVAPTLETWEDLEHRLRDVAAGLLGPAGIDVDMNGTVDDPGRVLPLEVRQNVLYIVKEALHNAVKHAQCRRLQVRWRVHRNSIHLHICDDGAGFVRGDRHTGNGLQNIRRRVVALGGTMTITSEPGAGTTIDVAATLTA